MKYLIITTLTSLALTAVVDGQEGANDVAKFSGAWKVVAAQDNRPGAEERYLKQLIVFEKDTWLVYDGAIEPERLRATLKFNLSTNDSPKHIDIFGTSGGDKAKTPMRGIYLLDGNKLTISWSKSEVGDRPVKFDVNRKDPNSRQTTLFLERFNKGK